VITTLLSVAVVALAVVPLVTASPTLIGFDIVTVVLVPTWLQLVPFQRKDRRLFPTR